MAETAKAYLDLAHRLQETATSLSQSNVQSRLNDCLRYHCQASGCYGYVMDVYGDDSNGDVVYCIDSDTFRAPYAMGSVGGKAASCAIDFEAAKDVVPRMVYDEEAEDDDHMTAMEAEHLYSQLPLYERFISKDERKSAPSGSFAGKGKSFPILKPEDVSAAVHAMGRAGSENHSAGTLKANIIKIAKAKGWASHLPKAWQDGGEDSGKESRTLEQTGDGELSLVESAAFCQPILVTEAARTDYPVKLIQPGWGSSGYYPREVLERDGPAIFRAGTKMFWNHATDAEESQRPEGNLDHLAGVLTSSAFYDSAGKEGAGLYARAKVFSDYAEKVAEKAPHTGLSIRAAGRAKTGEAEGRRGPIIEALTSAQSLDFVTTPGAGGKVLTEGFAQGGFIPLGQPYIVGESASGSPIFSMFQSEAARTANPQSGGSVDIMDATQLKEVQDLRAELRKLRERQAINDAAGACQQYFAGVRVSSAVQQRVIGRILERALPLTEAGDIDRAKVLTLVESETKDECAYLERVNPTGQVRGMGAAVTTDPKEAAKQFTESNDKVMDELSVLMMGGGEKRKSFRDAFKEGRSAA